MMINIIDKLRFFLAPILLTFMIASFTFVGFNSHSLVYAQGAGGGAGGGAATSDSKQAVCDGLGLTGGNCGGGNQRTVNDLISQIINVLSIIIGVTAVIMIMVGGFKYITSAGDSNNISSAKNTILYALVGLVVVALAQLIVKFVLSKVPS